MNESKKFTILIVDDSSIIIKRVTGIIKDLNNTDTILHAGNYVKALQLVNQFLVRNKLLNSCLKFSVIEIFCPRLNLPKFSYNLRL